MIERRRAEEFAAMALAGEDDDDEDDDNPRRESISKTGANGAPAPTRSLKGKETFKARQPSREEICRAVASAKEKTKKGSKKSRSGRKRRDEDSSSNGGVGGRGRSFVEDLLSDASSSDDEDRLDERDRRKRRREDEPNVCCQTESCSKLTTQGMAGLQYAMGMHQSQTATQSLPESELGGFFAHGQPSLPSRPYRGGGAAYGTSSNPYEGWGTNGLSGSDGQYSFLGPHPGHSIPSYPPQPPLPGQSGMQWNQDLIARYAEFQLQQNHQKQQRALLERQRAQLAEMGIPVDDRSLLDQIFGTSGSSSHINPATHAHAGNGSLDAASHSSGTAPPDTFEWPTLSRRTEEGNGMKSEMYGYTGNGTTDGSSSSRYTQNGVDDIPWGVGGVAGLPTPPSPEMIKRREDSVGGVGMAYAMADERRRMGVPL